MTTRWKLATLTCAAAVLGSARSRVNAMMPSVTQIEPGVWIGREVSGAHNVRFDGNNSVGRGTSFQGYEMEVGHGSTLGIGCVLNGPLSIGRYAQLGSYVGIYGVDHPIDVAVPNVNRNFAGGAVKSLGREAPVTIGHGCWLGHGAVVLRGVTIGNGSVVGAGCVVTTDVPPYSVVVGVPAGSPKPRFDAALARALDESGWWSWSSEEQIANQELFLTSFAHDPEGAARLLNDLQVRKDPPGKAGLRTS